MSGNEITAPHNFALDSEGGVVSVNGTFFDPGRVIVDGGWEYDGSTARLTARTPITPGAHTLYLSVFDATAKNSRFTPTSPNWANVEAANVLPDMLVSIFTERASVADATKEASSQITDVLNSGS